MTPFEALYGRSCRTSFCWYESGESSFIGPKVVPHTTEKVKMIQEKIDTKFITIGWGRIVIPQFLI